VTFHTTLCFAPSDMKSVKHALPGLENETQPATIGEPSVRSVCRGPTLHHLCSYIPTIDAGNDRLTTGTSVCWFGRVTHAPWIVFLCLWEKIVSPPVDVEIYSWVCLAAVVLPSLLAASKDVAQRPHSSCPLPADWCSRHSGCDQTCWWSRCQPRIYKFEGAWTGGVDKFFGIPYAQPSVGDLRFLHLQPPLPVPGTTLVSKLGRFRVT